MIDISYRTHIPKLTLRGNADFTSRSMYMGELVDHYVTMSEEEVSNEGFVKFLYSNAERADVDLFLLRHTRYLHYNLPDLDPSDHLRRHTR